MESGNFKIGKKRNFSGKVTSRSINELGIEKIKTISLLFILLTFSLITNVGCYSDKQLDFAEFSKSWMVATPETRGKIIASLSRPTSDKLGLHIRGMNKKQVLDFLGPPSCDMGDSITYDVGHFGKPKGYRITWWIRFDSNNNVKELLFDD